MTFKDFCTDFDIVTPKPNKISIKINLKEYKELLNNSTLSNTRKKINVILNEGKGEIPIFCEQFKKFYLCDIITKNVREIKTREDKELCGTLLNAMYVKEFKGSKEKLEEIKTTKYNWDVPGFVFSI